MCFLFRWVFICSISATEVLSHPLFWKPNKRLLFLRDASDRVENDPSRTISSLLFKSRNAVFTGTWDGIIDQNFIDAIRRKDKIDKAGNPINVTNYNYQNLQSLLRFIRNSISHHWEVPEVQVCPQI